ncbi:MAG: hypothetical protein KC619_22965 [Myxococcales bacterium]|nr:hypothetical protein [Myxococcales bacterium]
MWTEPRFPLAGLVAPSDWSAFTTWLEGGEDACAHDASSYEPWFADHPGPEGEDPVALAEALYEAMRRLAGTGPCRCAAGNEVWGPYPQP